MRFSVIVLVVLGLVAAFSAALLVTSLKRPLRAGRQDPSQTATVVYVTKSMPSISVVQADMLATKTMPAREAPQGFLSDPTQAVGRVLVRPVVEGQPLTQGCFATSSRGVELVAQMPPGKRAMTVQLTHSRGLEGLLYPGSVVDVIASFKLRNTADKDESAVSTTLVHGVEVLAIDDQTVATTENTETAANVEGGTRKKMDKSMRVTLLVDTEQAKALQLATEYGAVSLALRNPLDSVQSRPESMVLSGGQLASMAEYLASSLAQEMATQAPPPPPPDAPLAEAPPPPAPEPEPAPSASKWEVSVMRPGKQDEIVTFTDTAAQSVRLAKEKR